MDALNYCLHQVNRNRFRVECKKCFCAYLKVAIPILCQVHVPCMLIPDLLLGDLSHLYERLAQTFCFHKRRSGISKVFVPDQMCINEVKRDCDSVFWYYEYHSVAYESYLYTYLFVVISNKWLMCSRECIPKWQYTSSSDYKSYTAGIKDVLSLQWQIQGIRKSHR